MVDDRFTTIRQHLIELSPSIPDRMTIRIDHNDQGSLGSRLTAPVRDYFLDKPFSDPLFGAPTARWGALNPHRVA
ncbi:MAG: hypothetical protein WCC92_13380 [Candidatus Korobacteraceae bacterium]